MAVQLLSPGEGQQRDVVLVYHIDPLKTGPSIVGACPGAVVGVEVFVPLAGHYNLGHGLTGLSEAIDALRAKTGGDWAPGLVLLVGFSEGCQAIRSHLLAGAWPSAVLAVDGTHASNPPAYASQIEPFKRYFDAARSKERLAYVTHTAITIPERKYLSTTETVALVAPMGPGAVLGSADHPGGSHRTAEDGWLFVDSWPGADKAAHIAQQVQVLPYCLEWTLQAARVARAYLPAQLGGRPGGGGGSPPAGRPPGSPPRPPAGDSGGGGEALAWLAFFGLGALALGGRR